MSTSGLQLPTSTELEGRVRAIRKVAINAVKNGQALYDAGAKTEATMTLLQGLENILGILEDGRS